MYQPKTLADKATLVRTSAKRQANSIKDEDATSLVEQSYGTSGAGQFNKRLFKNSQRFLLMNQAIYALTKYVTENTSPWLDGGWRVLPNAQYLEFTAAVRNKQQDIDNTVAEFNDHWEEEVAADMMRQGNMAKRGDYHKRHNMGVKVTFMPIANESDFRVDVTDEDRAALAQTMADVEATAARDMLNRLIKPLSALSKKLGEFTGEKNQRFHESMVEVLGSVMDTLEKLNQMNNDPVVATLISDVRANFGSDIANPKKLKGNQQARDEAKAKLDNILAKFQ